MTAGVRERIPAPVAINGVVTNDVATRTLIVRRPQSAISGYEKLLWREAHGALTRAVDSGWLTADPFVWGGAFGTVRLSTGCPVMIWRCCFIFRPVKALMGGWSASRVWLRL